MILARIADPIVLAWGVRRAAIAFAAGAVSVLALEPIAIWPVMFLTFPVLVWLIDGATAGRWGGLVSAAVAGWWFGLGYFLAGLYWVGYAFLVDADKFGWLLPIAVLGLPALLALFTGFGAALARLLWTRGALRILTLAAALTVGEWLRGHLLTGFAWNAFGYALTGPLALAQNAAWAGIWGLTVIAVAVFSSPATLADEARDTPRPFLALFCAALALAAMATYGAIRLATTPTTFVDGVRLRIVQPAIPQDRRFNYGAKREVMDRYFSLSDTSTGPQSRGVADVTHLIWPESAFPFFLTREPDVLADIAKFLPADTVLITGAARAAEPNAAGAITRAYNSVYVIGNGGTILAAYDKVHLVPFGEYLPLQNLLERRGLTQLVQIEGGFLPGDRHRVMAVPGAPAMLPLVCYEVVFPEEAVPPAGERPGWILNVTNDAWFGESLGPYQHLQHARMRAIEQGLPLVRAANSGISAVIDPLGRTIQQLSLGSVGVVDSRLPAQIAQTFYARTGDRHIMLVLAAFFVLITIRRARHR